MSESDEIIAAPSDRTTPVDQETGQPLGTPEAGTSSATIEANIDGSAAYLLPGDCSLLAAEDIFDALRDRDNSDGDMIIDGSKVVRTSTALYQLLLSAKASVVARAGDATDGPTAIFKLINPSPALIAGGATLGLSTPLFGGDLDADTSTLAAAE